ncbi:MAG: extracellular solute-binding protein [Clostridiales bacterium]|nr:extracellular solute-binding protein [Clostridiales bacterium]
MKKLVSIVAAAAIALGTLTGCGGEKKDSALKVRVWSADGATKQFMTQKVDEFNKTTGAEKGINIEYQVISSNMSEMVKSAFENGDGPELVGCPFNDSIQYRKQGYIVSVDELDGGKEYLESIDFDIPETETFKQNGKTYIIPTSTVTGGLIYNKDLFKKAGIVDEKGEALPPSTWDELIKDAKKIHEADSNKYGVGFPMKDGIHWWCGMGWAMTASYERDYTIDLDKQEYTLTDSRPEMYKIMKQIKSDNSCFPGSESLDNDTLRLQFSEGNIGMFFGASWDVGVFTDQFKAKCDWGVAPYPVKNENERYQQSGMISGTVSIGNSAVKTPEMSKAVMEVYKWMYSDDMISQLYEAGQWIPYNTKISDKADNSKTPKQWKEFCEMMKVTRKPEQDVKFKLEGDSDNIVGEKVWMDELTIDEAVKDLNTRYTSALKKGLADGSINPEYVKENQGMDYKIK